MSAGRLNLFQRAMLRWDALHPYSAVHVVRIEARLDPERLRSAIGAQLEHWGLTGLTVDEDLGRIAYAGGPARVELLVAGRGADEAEGLRAEIERQLNAPFAAGPPRESFRFFALEAGEGFHLGVAYDHFLAGGDCIALLLQGIVGRYANRVEGEPPGRAPDLYPPTYRRLLLRQAPALLKSAFSMAGTIAATRRAVRPRYASHGDGHNGVTFFRIEPERFASLRTLAKAWGVTLNDLVLASLLHALSPLAAARRGGARRRELSVASIVNLRRDFGVPASTAWGQFLSSFRVYHPVPSGLALRELAADVHAQTARIRERKLYLLTLLGLGVAGLAWPRLSPEQRRRFFAKHHTVWGGVTPLYVDPLWNALRGADRPREYLRVVSTGPLSPLVLALTTLGEAAWVGVSFRTEAFSRETAQCLAADLRQCLERPESCVAS